MGDFAKALSQLTRNIASTLSSKAPPYIHCSKLNGFSIFLKDVAPLLGTATKKNISWGQRNAIEDINNILREFMQTYSQCTFENSSHFALTVPLSTVYKRIMEWMKELKKDLEQLGVGGIEKMFDTETEEIEQREKVDLKRIAEIIIQIRDQNASKRKDVRKHVLERTKSFKALGIPLNTEVSDLVLIPELPESLNLVIQHDELVFGKQIGEGISGRVVKGEIKSTGQVVAIKILHTRQLSSADMERFRNEIFAMSTLIHPTLLQFCGYTQEPPYCIATKFMKNGSLFHNLQNNPDFLTPTDRTLLAYDVARGMEFLHSRGVIHRDLKSLNILLDENKRGKICDFGFVRVKSSVPMTGLIGTSHWMAPEILLSSPNYDEKVDIYSYGILLWELLTSKQPYVGENPQTLPVKIIENNLRPEIPKGTPTKLRKLIEKCWSTDPEQRPPFKDIVTFFSDPEYHFPGGERFVLLREIGATGMHAKTASDSDYMRRPAFNFRRASSRTVGHKRTEGMNSIKRVLDAMKQGNIAVFKNSLESFKDTFSDPNADCNSVTKIFEEGVRSAPPKFKGFLIQTFFEIQENLNEVDAFDPHIIIQFLNEEEPDIVSMSLTMLALSKKREFLKESLLKKLLEFRKNGNQKLRVKALHAILTLGTPEKLSPYLNELLMFGLRRMPPKRLDALLKMTCNILKITKKEDLNKHIYSKMKTIAENVPNELRSLSHQCIYEYHKKEETLPDDFMWKVVDKYEDYKFIFDDFSINFIDKEKEFVDVFLKASMSSKEAATHFASCLEDSDKLVEEVIGRIPLKLPNETLPIVYEQILPKITVENSITNEEFYKAATNLFECEEYAKVCEILKSNSSSLEFAEKHGIYSKLIQLINTVQDKKKLSSYMTLMFNYIRRTDNPIFCSTITKLLELLKLKDNLAAPTAFMCLVLLSKYNSEYMDKKELDKAAEAYSKKTNGTIQGLAVIYLSRFK